MSSIIRVLFSLSITFGLSTLIGLLFSDKFWLVFATASMLQFILFYFYNQAYRNKLVKDLEAIKVDQIKETHRNWVMVKCPCDEKLEQSIDFRFDKKNIFTCEKCGKNVACDINVTTVMVTEPIYFDKQ